MPRTVLPVLPIELHVEILNRVSEPESLLRFRCVCKQWRLLIDDPVFAQSHHYDTLLIQNSITRQLYTIPLGYLNSISETTEIQATKLHQVIDHRFVNRLLVPEPSCHGQILIPRFRHSLKDDLLLWNPYKDGQSGTFIPPYVFSPAELDDMVRDYPCQIGLGYDASTDDYKVVKIATFQRGARHNFIEVHKTFIFSVRLGAWHMISDFPGRHPTMSNMNGAAFVNGAFHWITCDYGDVKGWIVALDLTTETYRKLSLPPAHDEIDRLCWLSLDAVGGYLFLSYFGSNPNTMWILKDYGTKNKWTELLQYCNYAIFPQIRPVACIKSKEQVIVYNLRSKELMWFHVTSKKFLKKVILHQDTGGRHTFNVQVLPVSLNCLNGIGGSASDNRGLEVETKKSNGSLKLNLQVC